MLFYLTYPILIPYGLLSHINSICLLNRARTDYSRKEEGLYLKDKRISLKGENEAARTSFIKPRGVENGGRLEVGLPRNRKTNSKNREKGSVC